MAKNVLEPLAEGFRDALELFVAVCAAPFAILKAFVVHTPDFGKTGQRARTH